MTLRVMRKKRRTLMLAVPVEAASVAMLKIMPTMVISPTNTPMDTISSTRVKPRTE